MLTLGVADVFKLRVAQHLAATIRSVTAKEKLLERAPRWSEEQAEAALRVVEAQIELAEHLDGEAKLSAREIEAREDRWAEANAREAIREEPW